MRKLFSKTKRTDNWKVKEYKLNLIFYNKEVKSAKRENVENSLITSP